MENCGKKRQIGAPQTSTEELIKINQLINTWDTYYNTRVIMAKSILKNDPLNLEINIISA